jgi:hypothetical protein
VAVWRESMRVVPTLGLRSIAAAVAMLDDNSRRHQAAKRVAPRGEPADADAEGVSSPAGSKVHMTS